MMERITIQTDDQGLVEITGRIQQAIQDAGEEEGMCTVFIQHTSASLIIQENAADAARRDLENWMNRLVEEDDPLYTHTAEGPDDMPAHIKSALTNTSIDIPVLDGDLALGTWQGIFLWEHRYDGQARNLIVHVDD